MKNKQDMDADKANDLMNNAIGGQPISNKWRPMGCRPDGWKPRKVECTSSGEIKAKKIKPQGKKHPELRPNIMVNSGPRAEFLIWDAVCKAYRNKKNGKFVQYGDSKKRNRKNLTKKQIAEIDTKAKKLNKEFSDAQYAKNNMTVNETFNTWIKRFARDFAHKSILNLSRSYDQKYSTEEFSEVVKQWKIRLVKIVSNEIENIINSSSVTNRMSDYMHVHNNTYKFGENFGVEKIFSLSTALTPKEIPLSDTYPTEQLMDYDEIIKFEEKRREDDIA
jgi:hypothetical protein